VVVSDEAPPSSPEEAAGLGCGALFWLLATVLIGVAYLAWVTAVEGFRIWVVLGLVLLVAACAAVAHRLMALTRR
jgi:hypothetical protein